MDVSHHPGSDITAGRVEAVRVAGPAVGRELDSVRSGNLLAGLGGQG